MPSAGGPPPTARPTPTRCCAPRSQCARARVRARVRACASRCMPAWGCVCAPWRRNGVLHGDRVATLTAHANAQCAAMRQRPAVRPHGCCSVSAHEYGWVPTRCGTQSYLKMLMWDNLIHADLHPGNVLIRIEARRSRQRSPAQAELSSRPYRAQADLRAKAIAQTRAECAEPFRP